MKQSTDSCVLMIIHIEGESSIMESGDVITETDKKYNIIRYMSVQKHIESYRNELRLLNWMT